MPFFLDGGRDHWMRTASSISILFGRFDALLGRRFGGFGGLLGIALGLLWQQHRVDVGQHFKAEGMWDLLTLQDEVDNTETSDIFAHLSEEINTRAETHAGAEKNDNGKDNVLEEESGRADDESNILKSLMDVHGIHSAMNHDAILNVSEDHKLCMEEEASRIAQSAAEALRLSHILCCRDSFSVPTWTGYVGQLVPLLHPAKGLGLP